MATLGLIGVAMLFGALGVVVCEMILRVGRSVLAARRTAREWGRAAQDDPPVVALEDLRRADGTAHCLPDVSVRDLMAAHREYRRRIADDAQTVNAGSCIELLAVPGSRYVVRHILYRADGTVRYWCVSPHTRTARRILCFRGDQVRRVDAGGCQAGRDAQ